MPLIRRFVIMGVSGCGKSSVGEALAAKGAVTFIDGDTLHPASNVSKMSRGVPLTDEDRRPWLMAVGKALVDHQARSNIFVGCSALKRSYRDLIRDQVGEPVCFVHLHGDLRVLEDRMNHRTGHFMPASLLQSQLATLEPLQSDELGFVIDIDQTVAQQVQEIQRLMQNAANMQI